MPPLGRVNGDVSPLLPMDTTTRFLVAVLGTLLVVACSKSDNLIASEEAYLKMAPSIGREARDRCTHIKNKRISFSGNDLLSGEGIQICTTGASVDQPYFDSESCDNDPRNDPKRKYGTYNKITGALDLTNEVSANSVALITGRFKCVKTEPVAK